MLSFAGSLKVFVALEACGRRKGFNRLQTLVIERICQDLRDGALFVFSNRKQSNRHASDKSPTSDSTVGFQGTKGEFKIKQAPKMGPLALGRKFPVKFPAS